MNWTKERPDLNKECVFATAHVYKNVTEYRIWSVEKIDGEDDDGNSGWYWGLLDGDGSEYGDIDDLVADYYCILPDIQK